MKRAAGFTLIELMIVIAIIAILAAIAMPSYLDYIARTQVAEGISLSSEAKDAVSEYYSNYTAWPTSNGAVGLAAAASISGRYVSQTQVGANGVITMSFNRTATSARIKSSTLTLTPADNGGSVAWTCSGTIATKYLPSACR